MSAKPWRHKWEKRSLVRQSCQSADAGFRKHQLRVMRGYVDRLHFDYQNNLWNQSEFYDDFEYLRGLFITWNERRIK